MKKIKFNRNVVFFLFSSGLSITSSNIIQFLLSLYVLDLTKSGTLFASMLSIIIIPRLFFSPIAGVLGDKINRKNLISAMGCVSSFVLILYGIVYFKNSNLEIWTIFLLVVLLEIVETFSSSSSAGVLPLIIDETYLAKAVSISSMIEGASGIIAPLVAAYLYYHLELGYGLIVASILIMLSSILVFSLKIKKQEMDERKETLFKDFVNGLKLIKNDSFLSKLVILAPLVNLFLTSIFSVSLVYILRKVIQISDLTFGNYEALLAAVTLLAPILAIRLTKKRDMLVLLSPLIFVIFINFLIMTIVLVCRYFNIIDNFKTLILLFVTSAVVIAVLVIMNIATGVLLRKYVPINYLSRVISVVNTLATISVPIGQITYGKLLDEAPFYITFLISSIGCLILFFLSKSILKNNAHNKLHNNLFNVI